MTGSLWVLAFLAAFEAEDPRWLALLHYEKTLVGYESRITDPDFFLSQEGRFSPRAELAAARRALHSGQPASGEHHECRFPARFQLLREVETAQGRVPPKAPDCPALVHFLETHRTRHIGLVFASAFIGNPASSSGHLFLVLKARAGPPAPLDSVVNFSAHTADGLSPREKVLGLTGGLEGRFSLAPYYLKRREYGAIEQRDLWTYEIAVPPQWMTTLLLHIWELIPIRFSYFFLSENCAFQMAALLDTVVSDRRVTEGLGSVVLPVDVIRRVVEVFRPDAPHFEPAPRTHLNTLMAHLHPWQIAQLDCLTDPRCDLDLTKVAEPVLTAGRYQEESDPSRHLQIPHRRILDEVIRRRTAVEPAPAFETQWVNGAPETGHGVHRLGVGFGWPAALQLEARWALHDHLDQGMGHSADGDVEFLRLRVGLDEDGAWLEAADLFAFWFLPEEGTHPTWRLALGMADATHPERLVGARAGVGVGHGGLTLGQKTLAFALLDGAAGVALEPEAAPAVVAGGELGVRLRPAWGAVLLTSRLDWPLAATASVSGALRVRVPLASMVALDADARVRVGSVEGALSVLLYH